MVMANEIVKLEGVYTKPYIVSGHGVDHFLIIS